MISKDYKIVIKKIKKENIYFKTLLNIIFKIL